MKNLKKKKKKKNFMLFIYGKTYVVQHPCNLVYFVLLRWFSFICFYFVIQNHAYFNTDFLSQWISNWTGLIQWFEYTSLMLELLKGFGHKF